MSAAELDSFIFKFKYLWTAGYDAHLDINSHAGQAWLGLHVRLGHAHGPLNQDLPRNFNRSRNGPARQRRREKRAADREEAEEAQKEKASEVEDKIPEENDKIVDFTTENVENARIIDIENLAEEEKNKEPVLAEEADEKIGEMIEENVEENKENVAVEQAVEEDTTGNDEQPMSTEMIANAATATVVEASNENLIPPVVIVHAIAVLDDSPNDTLTDDEFRSLTKILRNKDHLINNIANIEYSHLSTKELRGKFKHTVGLVIFVKTCNLWEGARNYLWKHIGRDTWTLRNGTEINIVRIHQK